MLWAHTHLPGPQLDALRPNSPPRAPNSPSRAQTRLPGLTTTPLRPTHRLRPNHAARSPKPSALGLHPPPRAPTRRSGPQTTSVGSNPPQPGAKGEWMAKFLPEFISWCGQKDVAAAASLQQAISSRNLAASAQRRFRHNLTIHSYIHPRAPEVAPPPACQEIHVQKLEVPYPPLGHWACETPEIFNLWSKHLATRKLPEPREKRQKCLLVDLSRVTTIKRDESRLIYDAAGGELIGVVYRDFCGSQEVLEWADDIIKRRTGFIRTVRVSPFLNAGHFGFLISPPPAQ